MISDRNCFFRDTQCMFNSTNPDNGKTAFIIGSAAPDFSNERDLIKNLLIKYEYYPYFAPDITELGAEIFCQKICRNILYSEFCVVFLNSPSNKLISQFPPEEDVRTYFPDFPDYKSILYPSPNVWFEYGLLIGLRSRKNIIPIFKRNTSESRAFDIQGLDTISFTNLNDLSSQLDRVLSSTEWDKDFSVHLTQQGIQNYLQDLFRSHTPLRLNSIFSELISFIPEFITLIDQDRLIDFEEHLNILNWLFEQYDKRVSPNTEVLADAVYLFLVALGSIIIELQKWKFLSPLLNLKYYNEQSGTHFYIFQHEKIRGANRFRELIDKFLQDYINQFEVFSQYSNLFHHFHLLNLLFAFFLNTKSTSKHTVAFFMYSSAQSFRWFFDLVFIQHEIHIIENIFDRQYLKLFANFIRRNPYAKRMESNTWVNFNPERDFEGQLYDRICQSSS